MTKQISLLLLVIGSINLNSSMRNNILPPIDPHITKEQAALRWAYFVQTPQYIEQVANALKEATQEANKYEYPAAIKGYNRYRKTEFTCTSRYILAGQEHPYVCCTCSNAYQRESKKTQHYITKKSHENDVKNVLVDLFDHGYFPLEWDNFAPILKKTQGTDPQ